MDSGEGESASYIGTTRTTEVRRERELLEAMELQREALRRRAKLLAEGLLDEPAEAGLRIRVQPTLLELYQKAPDEVRALARQAMRSALQAIVLSYWLGGYTPQPQTQAATQPVIINLNINNNKAESRVNININVDLEALEELRGFLEWIAYQSVYPKPVKQKAMRYERLVKELIKQLAKTN